MRTAPRDLTAEEVAEAERIFQALKASSEDEMWRIAQLLASKPDSQLLGATEYEVRDIVHEIGAKAFQTALDGRKRGVPRVESELSAVSGSREIHRLSL